MFLFSIATPLGIGIAWAVTELAEAEESPWSAALTAVGAGTFLFVATIECAAAAPPLRPPLLLIVLWPLDVARLAMPDDAGCCAYACAE